MSVALTEVESSSQTPVQAAPRSLYFPTLDGLRFVAFFLVFIHHLPPSGFAPLEVLHEVGYVGVSVFLTLSAYLLTSILIVEHQRTGAIGIGAFYLRRGLRIWPLYFAFVAVMIVLTLIKLPFTPMLGFRFATLLTFVDNIASGLIGYNPTKCTDHLWTVSLEEQFYLVLPWLLRRWLASGNRPVRPLLILWALMVIGRVIAVIAGMRHPFIWTSVLSGDSILLGVGLAFVPWAPRGWRRTAVLIAGVLLILSPAVMPALQKVGFHQVMIYAAIGLGAGLLTVAALNHPALGFLGSRPLRYLGKISYGLYVFHILAIWMASQVFKRPHLWILEAGLALALTVGMSAFSYQFYERRFLELKKRFEKVSTRAV